MHTQINIVLYGKFYTIFLYSRVHTVYADARPRYELGSHFVYKVVFSSKRVQRESINIRNLPTTDITVLSITHQFTRKLPVGHERTAVIGKQRLWASRRDKRGA